MDSGYVNNNLLWFPTGLTGPIGKLVSYTTGNYLYANGNMYSTGDVISTKSVYVYDLVPPIVTPGGQTAYCITSTIQPGLKGPITDPNNLQLNVTYSSNTIPATTYTVDLLHMPNNGTTGYFEYLRADNLSGGTGYFKYLNADYLTGTNSYHNNVSGYNGNFTYISGTTGYFDYLAVGVDLHVLGDTEMDANLTVNGNQSIDGNLIVKGNASFDDDVTFYKNLTGGTASFNYITGGTASFNYITGGTGSFKNLTVTVTQPITDNSTNVANTQFVNNYLSSNALLTNTQQTATTSINLTNTGFNSTPSSLSTISTGTSSFICLGIVCSGNGKLAYIWGYNGTYYYIYIYSSCYNFVQLYSTTTLSIVSVATDYTGRYIFVSFSGYNQPIYSFNYGFSFNTSATGGATPFTGYNGNHLIGCSCDGSCVVFATNDPTSNRTTFFININLQGGASWTATQTLNSTLTLGISLIGFNQVVKSIIAVTNSAIYLSTDKIFFNSLSITGTPTFSGIICNGINPTSITNNYIYVGTANNNGIYYSSDSGSSFTQLTTNNVTPTGITCSSDGSIMYYSTSSGVYYMFNHSNVSNTLTTNSIYYGRMCMSGTGSLLFVIPVLGSSIKDTIYTSSTNQNFSLYNDVRLPKSRVVLYNNPSYSYGSTTSDVYYPNQLQILSTPIDSTTITLNTPFYETYVLELKVNNAVINLPLITEQTVGLTIRFILQNGNGTQYNVTFNPATSSSNAFYTASNSGSTPVTTISSSPTSPMRFVAIPSIFNTYDFLWALI